MSSKHGQIHDSQNFSRDEQDIATVLAALNTVALPCEMEQRVLHRLATHTEHRSSRPWATRRPALLAWSAGALAAACTLCIAFLHRPSTAEPGRGAQTAAFAPTRQSVDVSQARGDAAFIAGNTRPRMTPAHPALGIFPRQRGTELTAQSPSKPRDVQQPSFPAPEMPLTEQERLLLVIAHRGDPVQVAMLNPTERDRTLRRERAADEAFFAPTPLPADLQHEINLALRSQYVNTPPPASLASLSN